MKLCLGTFFQVFKLCRNDPHTVNQPKVYEYFFADLLPSEEFELSKANPKMSKIMSCIDNSIYSKWREQIRESIKRKTLEVVQRQMWERVYPLIAPQMFDSFLYTLTYIIQSDDSIGEHTPLNIGEEPMRTFGQLRMNEYETYVTSLFLYAALNTENHGAKFLHEITPEYLANCTEIMQKGTTSSQRVEPAYLKVQNKTSELFVQGAQTQIPTISTCTRNRESVGRPRYYESPTETQPAFRFGNASVSSMPKAFLNAYLQKLPTLPQKTAGFISDLMYDTCPAAFLGRDNELARLYSFACDERPLLWWAITGSAGRGKTRLAHEFLKQLNSDEQWLARTVNWRAFVSDFSETGMYLPQGPVKLFIVIDYVFAYEESIANWIEWLSSHLSDGHRIRILLIERDDQKIDPSGQTMRAPWEELFSAVPQDPMLMIRLKYSRENLNLNEAIISSKDAGAIVRSYCANKNISLAPHQIDKIHFCVMTFLDRDNNFNPLQLLLLTEYFIKNEHQGTSSPNIFHSALESIVAKERITLQRLFNIEFCEQDAFDCVLLFATIVGSINLRSELFQELVLCDRSTLKNVLTKMEVSRKCERGKDGAYYLRGIQPDMIGEHFVHTFFSAQSDEQLCRILYSIHTRHRYELSRFLLRYVQDFKKEIIAQGRLNIFSGYLPDKNTSFIVHDSVGNEVICDILFTFDSEENGKSYIVYTDNTRDAGGKTQVYASIYDPATANSQLWPIQTEKEWGIIEIILSELQNSIQEYGADIDSDALTELIDERIHATFGDA